MINKKDVMHVTDKPYLFLDFDDTIVDSLPPIVDMLNKKYGTNFKYEDVNSWDMTDCWPTLTNDELNEAFESDKFWDNLYLKEDVYNSLGSLQYLYNICVISKGTTKNLDKKQKWIMKHLNKEKVNIRFIPIELGHSKGEIPMPPRSVMIDDNEQYLDETEATIKILYESYKDKEWNKHWDGLSVDNWNDLYLTLSVQAILMNGKLCYDTDKERQLNEEDTNTI